jgi:hypothetical protein
MTRLGCESQQTQSCRLFRWHGMIRSKSPRRVEQLARPITEIRGPGQPGEPFFGCLVARQDASRQQAGRRRIALFRMA